MPLAALSTRIFLQFISPRLTIFQYHVSFTNKNKHSQVILPGLYRLACHKASESERKKIQEKFPHTLAGPVMAAVSALKCIEGLFPFCALGINCYEGNGEWQGGSCLFEQCSMGKASNSEWTVESKLHCPAEWCRQQRPLVLEEWLTGLLLAGNMNTVW